MNLTDNEHAYLTAIMLNEYGEGWTLDSDAEDIAHTPVWSWSPAQSFGASAGGIASSLCKKGLAIASGYGEEQTIELTIAGANALKSR